MLKYETTTMPEYFRRNGEGGEVERYMKGGEEFDAFLELSLGRGGGRKKCTERTR